MNRKNKRKNMEIPRFKSAREEAEFWETHDFADYWDDTEEVEMKVARKLIDKVQAKRRKRLISLRLAEWQIEKAKKIAANKKMPYQALLRSWINEGLRENAG